MNKPNFFIAAMIAAACTFSACSERTVASTDQYPTDGTETTTDQTDDTGIADTGMDTGDDQGIDREDVSDTGEGVDMDRMGNVDRADAALETMPAATRELVMPVRDMMEQLRTHETTGNVDQDFANMMIVHHQGAINMSNQVLQSGDNDEITSRARELITRKQQEMEQLQQYASNQQGTTDQTGTTGQEGTSNQQGATGQQGDPAQQLRAATEGTMEQLQQQELNGDADHDYAHLLIMHFEDAIEMAQVELQHGQDPELKRLAQQIVDENQRQISELETWTSNNSR